jgi:hypothetical protein
MQENRAFWRAIHSLAHPVTIFAVLMSLFNDHWWRHNYPSWLTGKMGDFTWLIFAPMICAMLVAWIIPARLQDQEKIVGVLSFGFIGVWFATAKTIPVIHQMTTNTVEWIVGWEGTLRIDPTDLITLPALLVGWWVWSNADNRALNMRPVAWVIFGLGIMGTLASSGPNYVIVHEAITCINEDDSTLAVFVKESGDPYKGGIYRIYASDDGGLSWYRSDDLIIAQGDTQNEPECTIRELLLIDPSNPNIQYRYESGQKIERSTDGGLTWTVEHDLSEVRQENRLYYYEQRMNEEYPGNLRNTEPGPYDAVIHEPSGNIIFAMGWDGILVRKPDASWEWVAVDRFYLEDFPDWTKVSAISNKVNDFIKVMIVFSIALFPLVLITSVWYMDSTRMKMLFAAIGWLSWALLVWEFKPMHLTEIYSPINSLNFIADTILLFIFVILPGSIIAIWNLFRNFRRYIPHTVIVGLISSLLFLFPYVLWTQGTIPAYSTAREFALLLTGCSLLGGGVYLRRVLPVGPNKKQLDDRWRPVLPIRPEEFFHRDDADENNGE